jgi:hypothetical protein
MDFQEGSVDKKARPLSVVLLLSGTNMFFDSAMISYTVGLGIYLGSVWQQNLDPHSSDDSRNIFIVFLASAVFCFCAFCLLEISPHPGTRRNGGNLINHLKTLTRRGETISMR